MNILNWCRQMVRSQNLMVVLGLVAVSCGGSAAPKSTAQTGVPSVAPPDTLASRIFDFRQDTVLSPLVSSWPREDRPRTGPGNEPVDGENVTESVVYKVQLATTKDLSSAQAARAKAVTEFKQDVQIDYEVPYYKIRVGSFVSPQAAESLLQQARKLGYQGAWAVRVRASQQAP